MNILNQIFGRCRKQVDHRLPHEIFPELLEWQRGDDVEFSRDLSGNWWGTYWGVDDHGGIIFRRKVAGHLFFGNAKTVRAIAFNKSLQTRRVEARLSASEYDRVLQTMQTEIERVRQEIGIRGEN